MDEFLTPSQVAELLKMNVETVFKLAAKGVIPAEGLKRSWRFRYSWRFRRTDILALATSPFTHVEKKPEVA